MNPSPNTDLNPDPTQPTAMSALDGAMESHAADVPASGGGGGAAGTEPGFGGAGAPRENGLGPGPASASVVDRALAEVAGTAGIQSTTQEGCGLAKTPQVNKDLYDIPMADQRLAIVCVGGPTQRTKGSVCNLRLVGFFASDAERAEHGDDLPAGNYMAVESDVAYTFGDKTFTNTADEHAYVKGMMARWAQRVRDRNRDFDTHVHARSSIRNDEEEKQLDAADKAKLAAQQAARNATADALGHAAKATKPVAKRAQARPLKGHHAVHDQSWAVISLMYDLDQEDQPLKSQWIYILYGAFPSADLARGHVSDTVQHARQGMKHYVVKMYKWLELDTIMTSKFKRAVPGVFKFDHQQQLWNGARGKKKEVEAFIRDRQQAEDNLQASQAARAAARPSVSELLREQTLQDDMADRTLPQSASASDITSAVPEPVAPQSGPGAGGLGLGTSAETVCEVSTSVRPQPAVVE